MRLSYCVELEESARRSSSRRQLFWMPNRSEKTVGISRQTLLDATTCFPSQGCFPEATIGSMGLQELPRKEVSLKSQVSWSWGGNDTSQGFSMPAETPRC